MVGITFPLLPVPDTDPEISGGGHPDPYIRGAGGKSPKKIFSAPRTSVWSKNKGAAPPVPSPRSATDYAQNWHTFMGEKKTSESDRDTENIFDFKWKKKIHKQTRKAR